MLAVPWSLLDPVLEQYARKMLILYVLYSFCERASVP